MITVLARSVHEKLRMNGNITRNNTGDDPSDEGFVCLGRTLYLDVACIEQR